MNDQQPLRIVGAARGPGGAANRRIAQFALAMLLSMVLPQLCGCASTAPPPAGSFPLTSRTTTPPAQFGVGATSGSTYTLPTAAGGNATANGLQTSASAATGVNSRPVSPASAWRPAANVPYTVKRETTSVIRAQNGPYGGSPNGEFVGGSRVRAIEPGFAEPRIYRGQQPSASYAPRVAQAPAYGDPPAFGAGQPAAGAAPPIGLGSVPPYDPNAPVFFAGPNRYADLDAYLEETQTGRLMFGVGVNSDAGVIGNVVIDEQNFDWRRTPTSFEDFKNGTAFRGAGQKFRIELAPGTQVQRYMFNFTEPYLFDTPVSLGLNAFYYTRYFRDWNEERIGGRTSLGYQLTPDLSANIALRAEEITISQPRVPTPPDLAEVVGSNQLYSVRPQIAHDTRDNTFLATEGHYLELAFEQAFGSFTFSKVTLDARKYFLLRERPDGSGRHTISLVGHFGVSGSDTPIYERFYAGGFSTLRGFSFRGASPVVQNVQVGGDFQALGSVEYLFPISADDMLKGVTFVDFGTVERTANTSSDNFRLAPGFGLRITVPALGPAPIALDFAFPLAKANNDDTQVFSFFVGFGR